MRNPKNLMRNSKLSLALNLCLAIAALMPAQAQTNNVNTTNGADRGGARIGRGAPGRRGGIGFFQGNPFGPQSQEEKEFNFRGGGMDEFLIALNRTLGSSLGPEVTEPGSFEGIHVPSMSLKTSRISA